MDKKGECPALQFRGVRIRSCSRWCGRSCRHGELSFVCVLSQKLLRGVPDALTCTSPSFVCVHSARVVHPLRSGAGVYLAPPAVTLKNLVTLVQLKLLLCVYRDAIILTSIQFITNNEVSASFAGIRLSSGEFPRQQPVWDVYCLLMQVAQMIINKTRPAGDADAAVEGFYIYLKSNSCPNYVGHLLRSNLPGD